MKNELTRYIDLLFAGARDADEIKQEILQNTLDRYDDLIAQGKSPEAAYRLAISGIGDINEILGQTQESYAPSQPEQKAANPRSRLFRAVAVALYIMCPLPVLILQDEAGVCLLLMFVAVATMLIVLSGKGSERPHDRTHAHEHTENREAYRILWLIAVIVYLGLSFSTQAWYITWIIFPMAATIQGIIQACKDLKEAD